MTIFKFYLYPKYENHTLNLREDRLSYGDFSRITSKLLSSGVLEKERGMSGVYTVLGKKVNSPEETLCTLDPFAYISHLSAMDHHGLTDRIPKLLFYSSPSPKRWSDYSKKRMIKDLGEASINDYKGIIPIRALMYAKEFTPR